MSCALENSRRCVTAALVSEEFIGHANAKTPTQAAAPEGRRPLRKAGGRRRKVQAATCPVTPNRASVFQGPALRTASASPAAVAPPPPRPAACPRRAGRGGVGFVLPLGSGPFDHRRDLLGQPGEVRVRRRFRCGDPTRRCCTPMVALPPLMDTTTFRSSGAPSCASASSAPCGSCAVSSSASCSSATAAAAEGRRFAEETLVNARGVRAGCFRSVLVRHGFSLLFSDWIRERSDLGRWLGVGPRHPRHRLRGGVGRGDRPLLHVQVEAHEGAGSRRHAADHL